MGFGNIIIVDNLPVVPREKYEKLEGVIRKIYGQIGLIKDDGLWMPIDPETQKTSGYCFIEFNTPLVILSLPTIWQKLTLHLFRSLQIFLLSYLRHWNIQLPTFEGAINGFRSTQDTDETSFYLQSILINQLVSNRS